VVPLVDGGASIAPDHVEALPNDVSKLFATADGSRLAIHGTLKFAGTVLAAHPVSVRVSHLKGGHSATLGAEAARGLARDQSISTIPESPARFRGRVIILAFEHNAVLDTAPPSVLELPVDWTGLP
jgi:hypothetical protein